MRHEVRVRKKKGARRTIVRCGDAQDALNMEFLRLWLGLSRLRGALLDEHRTARARQS